MKKTTGVLLVAIATTACTQPPPEPKSYEDCVLRHVQPGLTNSAVVEVTRACRAKFPCKRSSSGLFDDVLCPPPPGTTASDASTMRDVTFDDLIPPKKAP